MGQSGLCLPRIEVTGGDSAQGRKAEGCWQVGLALSDCILSLEAGWLFTVSCI